MRLYYPLQCLSIAIAVHVNSDDRATAAVVWEQESMEGGETVSRLYGSVFDLASASDTTGQALEEPFDTPLTPPFVYTSPVLESVSIDSDIRFALSYELQVVSNNEFQALLVVLESFSETLEQTIEGGQLAVDKNDFSDASINNVRAPKLARVGERDVVWTYLVENVVDDNSASQGLLIDSAIFSSRARFQEGQSLNFSFSNDDFNVFASDFLGDVTQDGYLISHHELVVDHNDNALIAFRESLRGPATNPLSLIPGVGLEQESIRLMVIPKEGAPFSLSANERGEIDNQVYDTDPNTTNDSAPLMFLRADKVLDIAVDAQGETTMLWSIWDSVNDDNGVKAVRLDLP